MVCSFSISGGVHSQSYSFAMAADTIQSRSERKRGGFGNFGRKMNICWKRNEFIGGAFIMHFRQKRAAGNAGEDDCGKLYF